MEIQNISGPDIIPQGFSPTEEPENELSNEALKVNPDARQYSEENKGNSIDTYA